MIDKFFKNIQKPKQNLYKKGNNARSIKEKFLKKSHDYREIISKKIALRKIKNYYKKPKKVLLRYLFILENKILYMLMQIK